MYVHINDIIYMYMYILMILYTCTYILMILQLYIQVHVLLSYSFIYLFIRLEYAGDNFVRHSGDAREFAKSQSMYM